MPTFKENGRCFNIRSAAIVLQGDCVLIHKSIADDFWSMPGGRIEFFETAQETVLREIKEELGCAATVIRPLWFVEDYFELFGDVYHEHCHYFLVEVNSPTDAEPEANFNGAEAELIFRWVPLARLKLYDLQPDFLLEHLQNIPDHLTALSFNHLPSYSGS